MGANNVNKERMRNENYRRTPTRRPFARPLSMILFVAVGFLPVEALQAKPGAGAEGLDRILNYISTGWDTLTRSMTNCNTVVDPKLTEASLLYLPAHFPVSNALLDLRKRCHVEIRELPARITGPGQVTTNITPVVSQNSVRTPRPNPPRRPYVQIHQLGPSRPGLYAHRGLKSSL